MQTREIFLNCTNQTLLDHKRRLLAEAHLVDQILADRQTTPVETNRIVPAQSNSDHQAEVRVRQEAAEADYRACQEAVGQELGEEIEFLNQFIWYIGNAVPSIVNELKITNYAHDILKGHIRYERGRWVFVHVNHVQPTPEECRVLAEQFKAAARKLMSIGEKVRSGQVNPAIRGRLEAYHLLTKGGKHGRWMCDRLAIELEKISHKLGSV